MTDPIFDGVKLMFIGMGTVIVFLLVMIWCMKLYAKLIEPIALILDPKAPEKPSSKPSATPTDVADEAMNAVAAAVLCAVKAGRKINSAVCGERNCKIEVVSAQEVKIDGVSFLSGASVVAAPEKVKSAITAVATGAQLSIEAPIPGTVMRINVRPGDRVEKGMELVMIEAMKMETPLKAGVFGRVVEVLVREKDVVTAGQSLMTVESL